MFSRRETILFLIEGVGIVVLTFLQINETFFIYEIAKHLLYLIFGCTLIYSLIKLFRDSRQVPVFDKFKPLLFGLLLIPVFFTLSYLVDTDGGKKRMITAGFNHDLNAVFIQLFKDKSYKLVNSGPFGATIYRGTYTLYNDTLTISNKKLAGRYPSGIFVIKKDNNNKKYFDPVDTTKSQYQLYIYKDFRGFN